MPKIDPTIAWFGCAALCSGYAVLLSGKQGRKFTVRHTWITVVVGVSFVLAFVALVDLAAAVLTLTFFVAGGAPMIARSWWLEHLYQQDRIEYLQTELDHERNHKDAT